MASDLILKLILKIHIIWIPNRLYLNPPKKTRDPDQFRIQAQHPVSSLDLIGFEEMCSDAYTIIGSRVQSFNHNLIYIYIMYTVILFREKRQKTYFLTIMIFVEKYIYVFICIMYFMQKLPRIRIKVQTKREPFLV